MIRKQNSPVVVEDGKLRETLDDLIESTVSRLEARGDYAMDNQCPEILVLMVGVDDKKDQVFEVMASRELSKSDITSKLIEFLKDFSAGDALMSGSIACKVDHDLEKHALPEDEAFNLTPREIEVLELLAQGYLYKEIASDLGVGFATVHSHMQNIYGKLDVRTRTEVVMKYLGLDRASA